MKTNYKMASNYTQEYKYLLAKKRVEKIKGLYIHTLVTLLLLPVLVFINLKFVSQYYWFWFSIMGMSIGLFFYWLGVLGIEKLGFGKDWEKRKINEYLNKE